jgi:RND family efflux transporter MFP subunit
MKPNDLGAPPLRTRRRWGFVLVLALGAGSATGCGKADGSSAPGQEAKILSVRVTKPVRRDAVRRVVLPATVRADYEVTLYSKVTGYLKEISKDRGDKVKAGELVALLEIPEMISEIAHAKASYELEDATFKRLEAIRKVEKTAVTDQDLDLARAKRDMADASLKKLLTMQNYTEIRAPFSGTVTERFVDPGAFIQQGKILSMVDTSKVRVLVDIPESEVRFATVGTETDLHFDALPGKSYQASISRMAESLDPLMRTMRVEVDVKNPEGVIYPGMFGRATFAVDRHPDALAVPSSVVTIQQDRAFVFVDAGGVAKKVQVTLGTEEGAWSEVVGGLTGQESLILPEGKALADGMPVRAEVAPEHETPRGTERPKTTRTQTAEGDSK